MRAVPHLPTSTLSALCSATTLRRRRMLWCARPTLLIMKCSDYKPGDCCKRRFRLKGSPWTKEVVGTQQAPLHALQRQPTPPAPPASRSACMRCLRLGSPTTQARHACTGSSSKGKRSSRDGGRASKSGSQRHPIACGPARCGVPTTGRLRCMRPRLSVGMGSSTYRCAPCTPSPSPHMRRLV